MLKNLAYTVPTLGRISIGEITVKNGKRLPTRLNHFKITAQHKKDGEWVMHPLHEEVAKKMNVTEKTITDIPVRLMFNTPSLNMRERYEAFDNNGRILCAGDGETARQASNGGIAKVSCPGPEHCTFGRENRCDVFARLNVQIEGQNDPMSSFIMRTGSFNAVKTLREKLEMMHALFGGRLVGVPLLLKLRQKSSSMSRQSKFYYVDLVLNGVTLAEAAKLAKETEENMKSDGIDYQAFEQAVMGCLNNGGFEDTAEEFEELEEFILGRNENGENYGFQGEHEGAHVPDGTEEFDAPMIKITDDEDNVGLAGLRNFLSQETPPDESRIHVPPSSSAHEKVNGAAHKQAVNW